MLAATAATAVDSGHWIYFQHVFARPFRVLRVCYVGSLLPEWHYYPINMVCLILFILLFTSLSVRSRMKMTHYALVQCPQYYLSLYYRQLKRERERETPDNFYFPFTSLHRSNASFWGIYSILIDIYLSHNNAHKMCVCVCENSKYYYTRRVRKCYDKQMEMVMPDAVQCDAAIGPDCQWKQPPDPKFNKYRKKSRWHWRMQACARVSKRTHQFFFHDSFSIQWLVYI